jgi:Aminoglycoside-2''-adenylyltransferase
VSLDPVAAPPVVALARSMSGYPGWWAVAGGWAVDLAVGEVTRAHSDIEVSLLRADLALFDRHTDGWQRQIVVPHPAGLDDAGTYEPWDGEPLHLPVHQVLATRPGERIDVVMSDSHGGAWLYRRDHRVARPLEQARCWRGGVPFLAPGITLLFKSKGKRAKDVVDREALLPRIGKDERRFLDEALRIVAPEDPWRSMPA